VGPWSKGTEEAIVTRTGGWLAALALGLALAVVGCGQPTGTGAKAPTPGGTPSASKVKLEVMVPCGEVGPMSEVIKGFEAAHPEIEVAWVPENMVTITRKILDGKIHPDVTLSMGDLEMDLLEKAGLLLEGTRKATAENSLAIMVPAGNPAGVNSIQDLTKPSVKAIAIPDPKENSVGLHAEEALKKAGVWDQVKGKVLYSQFAADSKTVAAQGQAQASIGYYPCAVEVHIPGQPPAKPKNLVLQSQLPADLYPAFSCEAAVLRDAKHPEEGKAFIEFMLRPESQQAFKRWEFKADTSKEM
jgi:molybdate transport system substrate-binding protein